MENGPYKHISKNFHIYVEVKIRRGSRKQELDSFIVEKEYY